MFHSSSTRGNFRRNDVKTLLTNGDGKRFYIFYSQEYYLAKPIRFRGRPETTSWAIARRSAPRFRSIGENADKNSCAANKNRRD